MRFILGLLFVFSTSAAYAVDVHGILRVVKGDVQIKSGETGQTAKAKLGAKVFPKDVIITGKDARAKVVMVDNNEINVSPESQIELQNYEYDPAAGKKDVLLNVIYGKVRSKVEQKYDGKSSKFQVKTPSAVAGVRGTDFMTSYNRSNNTSNVVTFHGKVDFGLPGPGGTIRDPVSVTPGTTASCNGNNRPSDPVRMDRKELARVDKESNVNADPGNGNDNGKKEERQPADEGKNEGEKKESDKNANKNDGKDGTQDGNAGKGNDGKKDDGSRTRGNVDSDGGGMAGSLGGSGGSGSGGPLEDNGGAGATGPGPGTVGSDRGPASSGGMMFNGDLAGSPNSVLPGPSTPYIPITNVDTGYVPPRNDTVNDVIQGGSGKLIISIINPNP